MIKLPENKKTDFDQTPRIFFVWGESMSGKTYMARQFPNPILLNTDGNAKKVDTPSIEINNFTEFCEAIDILEKGNHTFETIIIDLIDDIDTMLYDYICKKHKVESLADIAFGKGFNTYKNVWKQLMMQISKLKYNIIFISHIIEVVENGNTLTKPSLPDKQLNTCLGRCDLAIQTKKLGQSYLKIVTSKRENYKPEYIKNEQILNILKGCMALFEKPVEIKGDVK